MAYFDKRFGIILTDDEKETFKEIQQYFINGRKPRPKMVDYFLQF